MLRKNCRGRTNRQRSQLTDNVWFAVSSCHHAFALLLDRPVDAVRRPFPRFYTVAPGIILRVDFRLFGLPAEVQCMAPFQSSTRARNWHKHAIDAD